MKIQWTAPYYGVQHTQRDERGRRCSVQDNQKWSGLSMWYPGCGFSPLTSHHGTAAEARAAGEKWLQEGSVQISDALANRVTL